MDARPEDAQVTSQERGRARAEGEWVDGKPCR